MNKEIYNKLTKQEKIVANKIETKYKESRAGRKKDIIFIFLLSFLIVVFMGASFSIGYFMGVKTTANYFAEMAALFFKSSDIQIVANFSFNETKVVDYMFEKVGETQITKKDYIPYCDDVNTKCMRKEVLNKSVAIPGTIYYCEKPVFEEGYYYCDSEDITK
jgi:hypothetical protein